MDYMDRIHWIALSANIVRDADPTGRGVELADLLIETSPSLDRLEKKLMRSIDMSASDMSASDITASLQNLDPYRSDRIGEAG